MSGLSRPKVNIALYPSVSNGKLYETERDEEGNYTQLLEFNSHYILSTYIAHLHLKSASTVRRSDVSINSAQARDVPVIRLFRFEIDNNTDEPDIADLYYSEHLGLFFIVYTDSQESHVISISNTLVETVKRAVKTLGLPFDEALAEFLKFSLNDLKS